MATRQLLRLWIAVFFTFLGISQAWSWSDDSWPYRSHVVLNNTSASSVTDKVFEILLSGSDFHPDYTFSPAGADVRLYDSDDATELPFYIDKWEAGSESSRIFVKTSLAAGSSKTVYLYYGNGSVVPTSDLVSTLSESGLRYHTKPGRYQPASTPTLAQIETEFDSRADSAGYGCDIITAFDSISNGSVNPGGASNNIFFRAEHWFYVDASEAGRWKFEFSGDYTDGGAMFLDGVELHERWDQDLWWDYNWNNVNEIIRSNGIDDKSNGNNRQHPTLAEGWHVLKFFGSEGCCDGGSSVRFRKPGMGGWQTWSLANHAMIRSPSCATGGFSTAITPPNLQTSIKVGVDANGNDLLTGETISYTITITESNGQIAERVSITDDMSAQSITSISNVNAPAGAIQVLSGTVLTVSDITVPANSSVVVSFDALLDPAAAPGTVIANTADYNSPAGNAAYAKASLVSNDLTVAETAVVDLAIGVDTPTAGPGSIVTYTVTTTNNSASLAYEVVIGSHTGVFSALRMQFDGIESSPFKCLSGCPSSGLMIPVAGEEYDDGADSWGYSLISGAGGAPAGYDATVKQWRIPMSGDMNSNATSNNEVVIQYQLIIL
ncbi:MAG: DUF2341 domain-containing protein [Pseudomonadales bacterium]|nr:DUF2341 domain-containing protein [Pseudomonadales bacterium]